MPDPLTPVTQVSTPSGISTSMSLRLCSDAPSTRSRWFAGPAPRRRHRNRQLVAQVFRGQRPRVARAARRACRVKITRPPCSPAPEPQVDDVVGDADHVGVVLDDEHGVALVAQLPQDGDQPLVVARVQADRRLVEHVQRVDQRRPERRREVDALRLAARQRGRQPIERQVVEADVAQEPQPLANLAQDLVGDGRVLLRERQRLEEAVRVLHRQRADRRRSCARRRGRRAPRAAAARRRTRGRSGSRDSG